ncbi:MAG: hypothetical protein JWM11_6488 [Planctomycetaceae bacterium]|nr:hypothetical protein [Planctomycetaceae bacterium]
MPGNGPAPESILVRILVTLAARSHILFLSTTAGVSARLEQFCVATYVPIERFQIHQTSELECEMLDRNS